MACFNKYQCPLGNHYGANHVELSGEQNALKVTLETKVPLIPYCLSVSRSTNNLFVPLRVVTH